MRGTMVDFRANGGTATGYLSLPPSGHGPGLLVLSEWWGLVDHIKVLAVRFAAAAFVALIDAVVDFYDAGHAFFNDTRSVVYHPDAAALAWDRTLASQTQSLA